MRKTFIFNICSECNEPISIVNPCDVLGYNNFSRTNFHGELSKTQTEDLREELISSLLADNKVVEAQQIRNNTKVLTIAFE